MKRRLKELTILILVLGVIGIVVLVSGVVPIKASGGHWLVTRLLLDFASDRSVDFHSSGIEPPLLDAAGMVRLGAAVYDSNCSWCHGRPGLPMPVVAANMTPTPPYLPGSMLEREPRELFYIVKHGIKFAGMPAWPSHDRDDGVWPVVAFLKSLPEMSEETYLGHVRTEMQMDSDIARLVGESCAACHGEDGRGRAGERVPVLAEQTREYLTQTLRAYKTGERHSGVMQPIAARLTQNQIGALATYFSEKASATPEPVGGKAGNDASELGRSLANNGDGEQKIPSCVDCHGPGPILRSNEYPKLAGQPAWYIRNQLNLFANGMRGGTENANLMHPIADKLDQEQIAALAEFYSRDPP